MHYSKFLIIVAAGNLPNADSHMEAAKQHLQGIARILVRENLLEEAKAPEYQHLSSSLKQPLINYLVEHSVLPALTIATVIARHFGLPLLDLDSITLDSMPIRLVNEKLVRLHNLVPLYTRANKLFLATDDPGKQASLQEIQFHTGLQCSPVIVETDKLAKLIEKLRNVHENQALTEYMQDSSDSAELVSDSNMTAEQENYTLPFRDDAPVVKLVNKILIEAIKKGVSDIHFEPYERKYRIRYRHYGILTETGTAPVALAGRISARIKIMANLDISEKRIPQDGRFKIKFSSAQTIDCRVSTCPVADGEKVVMRILDPGTLQSSMEIPGLNALQKKLFLEAIHKPQGLILVTGPTGSGKTMSLYTALNILNTGEINISTAEDPVEIKLPGINQVSINPKTGLDFSTTLRAFLRQDPDVIMLGEIRDFETAEIAIKAAQTGHLVLSTLHTNSAAQSLTRLINMGIAPFNIASSLSLLIAQRLVRRLCDVCKLIREDVSLQSLIELGFSDAEAKTLKLYQAVGCNACNKGYSGRIALFEMMPISKAISQLIMSGGNAHDILHQAQNEGMLTIHQVGLDKIKEGLTTIEELNRVTID